MNSSIYLGIALTFVAAGCYILIFRAPGMKMPTQPSFVLVYPKKVQEEVKVPLWFKLVIYPVSIGIYELANIYHVFGYFVLGIVAVGMFLAWYGSD